MVEASRVAIVTPYGLFNYGNRLQNWAVDYLVAECGFLPETLVLHPRPVRGMVAAAARQVGHGARLKGAASSRYRRFRQFDSSITKKRVLTSRARDALDRRYDKVVVGSDQIWNPHQVDLRGQEYGIDFDGRKLISLSASFGVDQIPVERHKQTGEWLKRFESLSAREDVGVGIIRDLTGRDSVSLVDPTLAVAKEVWSELGSEVLVPKSPYLLTYFLGGRTNDQRTSIREFAASRSLEVVDLFDSSVSQYYSAGPQDFISLIASADAVVTDSFHGVAFSAIFDRTAFVAPRMGKNYSMSSRFETLQRKLGVEVVASKDLSFAKEFHFGTEGVRTALADEHEKLRDYLVDSLGRK